MVARNVEVLKGRPMTARTKDIIDKREKSHPTDGYAAGSPQWEPYEKPLLEERCHEVTEWWQIERQAKNITQACLFWI